MNRRTLASAVRNEGTGLFTGGPAAVSIEPVAIDPADSGGIVLESGGERFAVSVDRIDERPAHPAFAQMPPRSTALSASPGSPPVHTVRALSVGIAIRSGPLRTAADLAVNACRQPASSLTSLLITSTDNRKASHIQRGFPLMYFDSWSPASGRSMLAASVLSAGQTLIQ